MHLKQRMFAGAMVCFVQVLIFHAGVGSFDDRWLVFGSLIGTTFLTGMVIVATFADAIPVTALNMCAGGLGLLFVPGAIANLWIEDNAEKDMGLFKYVLAVVCAPAISYFGLTLGTTLPWFIVAFLTIVVWLLQWFFASPAKDLQESCS